MKMYKGVEVLLLSLLSLALDGFEWSPSHPGSFTPGIEAPVLIDCDVYAPELILTQC
jgi:hypothetical protein